MVTVSDAGLDVGIEGAMWGTPHKRALFGPEGSVGSYGTLSPSESDSVGPVGSGGKLSSSDLAGMMVPAVPAGIPFPVGPVGRAGPLGVFSPSDSDSVGPVGPTRTLSSSDFECAGPVGRWSSVYAVRRTPGGLVPMVWTAFPDEKDPVITQSPAEVLVGTAEMS